MDEYGLSPEERESLDAMIPGWEDMRPNEILQRASSLQEQIELEVQQAHQALELALEMLKKDKEE